MRNVHNDAPLQSMNKQDKRVFFGTNGKQTTGKQQCLDQAHLVKESIEMT